MGARFDRGLVQLTLGTLGARYVRATSSNMRLVSRMWPEELILHTLILFQLQNLARPGVEEFCLNNICFMGLTTLKTEKTLLSLNGNKGSASREIRMQ
jgi:hypothetical protein